MTLIPSARRARLKRDVLAVCRELIDAGIVPSVCRIGRRVRGCCDSTIYNLRAELRAEGLIDWDHVVMPDRLPNGVMRGLQQGDHEQVERNRLEVLAEKVARGEVPVRSGRHGIPEGAPVVRETRVYRHPKRRDMRTR